ncbi:alanine:cation symporter family protein [Clostridium sp. CM028]|uniref:alanine/glycine:cation symporter family protein n=1 Tax=unclassified Clostridium TaxID=2614128 RepID=UPI001C6F12B8|nr:MULTISPECIES: alanine/glycine:cation symporter family protein [unclassified Clostridium]MBW9147228.1 alanine:cation symporter family protein [Clostridium sp. CM027]MBW9150513.1 alanine:cation symporter family protein [Clostridium sp. CM028]UVE40847.1 alanine:cation symporter family protein [Clostridium sp. CM027]WLC61513.1 alanine:cation symporter family protein [Clostridium sp. CM028]
MLNLLNSIVTSVNNILWSYVLIILLISIGAYFTIHLKFPQFRFFSHTFKLLRNGRKTSDGKEGVAVSSFQAFCISVASHVGTGNLAGVAIAVTVGGPGAVFWMWVIALLGAGSSFVENTLAQIYKVKGENGYKGGPAYYMEKALGKRKLGLVFSVLITISFGLVFNSVQANTVTLAFEGAFGITRFWGGMILVGLTALVIFGGVKRIAKVAEILVPVMAVAYVFVAFFVIFKNIAQVPAVFKMIFQGAFGLKQFTGGGIGAAIMMGIKRGLFSNEAGMGSAPNAAATADVSHPVKQGIVQVFGVFLDTIVICSATAFIILISGEQLNNGLTGIELTQVALTSQVGNWGNIFIAVCIFMFAWSSIIGNYYYGESNIEFMNGNKIWLTTFRVGVLGMVFWGSMSSISIVWNMADLFMGAMALINLVVIFKLSKVLPKVIKDYAIQIKQGKDPVFHANSIDGLSNTECWDKD